MQLVEHLSVGLGYIICLEEMEKKVVCPRHVIFDKEIPGHILQFVVKEVQNHRYPVLLRMLWVLYLMFLLEELVNMA